jgi:ectoine hydroxylase-related dioxygenase (phytanoyl-CoA dioxygenase family)
MVDHARYRPSEVEPIPDPSSPSSSVRLFADGLGQDGMPFAVLVDDPPRHTRAVHHHYGDVLYLYVRGEHTVEGEATYVAGDVRWVRAGHRYGPETTGPEGGSWWVLSSKNPLPVEVPPPVATGTAPSVDTSAELQRFGPPYDWAAIDAEMLTGGAVVVSGIVDPGLVDVLNAEIDGWLRDHPDAGRPASGSGFYDAFLGHRTVRLHGLCAKLDHGADVIGHDNLVAWAERILAPVAHGIQLNAGELIQIGPGEAAQFPHRDTDSWPSLPRGAHPTIVNAMVALTPFTEANGATHLALGSHRWADGRGPVAGDSVRGELDPGDALLFRGDIVHGGGANTTDLPRRGLSISYGAGWLRAVENSVLNVPPHLARTLPARVQALLGYAAHDALAVGGGLTGLYENGDPRRALGAAAGPGAA